MKKLGSFSDLKSLINPDDITELEMVKVKSNNIKPQNLEAHYSVKGRAGKPVTIVKGFKGTKDQFKELAKELKNKCGVGGSIKNEEIIIQGKYRDKITSILTQQGHKVKRVGG
jgi:translation initiation factor 1